MQDIHSTLVKSFNQQVYDLVRQIPSGRVMTYGSVARLLGDPRRAREVGWAMHACPSDVPAHRVVNRLGAISGEPGDGQFGRRRLLLEEEGVVFDARGCCDLDVFEWLPEGCDDVEGEIGRPMRRRGASA